MKSLPVRVHVLREILLRGYGESDLGAPNPQEEFEVQGVEVVPIDLDGDLIIVKVIVDSRIPQPLDCAVLLWEVTPPIANLAPMLIPAGGTLAPPVASARVTRPFLSNLLGWKLKEGPNEGLEGDGRAAGPLPGRVKGLVDHFCSLCLDRAGFKGLRSGDATVGGSAVRGVLIDRIRALPEKYSLREDLAAVAFAQESGDLFFRIRGVPDRVLVGNL